MTGQTDTNQSSSNLDSHVGTLLQEALDAAGRVEAGLPPDGEAVPRPATESGTTEHHGPAAGPARANAETSAPPADIGQLDDDLARLTESLIRSEEVSPHAAMAAPVEAGSEPAMHARATIAAPPPQPGTVEPTSVASAPAPQEPPLKTAIESRGPDAPPPPTAAPSITLDPSKTPATAAGDPAGSPPTPRAAQQLVRAATSGIGPIALAGLAAASAPLASKPKVIRDTVGWFAMWTLFLAVCVWVYVLFVHKPAAPRSLSAPIELVTQDRSPAESAPSAESATAGKDAPAGHEEPESDGHEPGSHH